MSTALVWADRQWITWPRSASMRFPSLRGVAGDGHVLATVPQLAAVAPLLVLTGGFATGLLRLGYDDVFTESVWLLAMFVAIAFFSSQLGVLLLVGFVLGDVLSTTPVLGFDAGFGTGVWWSTFGSGFLGNLAHIRLPRLVTYLLLAALMVVLPRAARGAVSAVGRTRRTIPASVAWLLVSGLLLVITWLGVTAWAAAAPTLIRPVFVWSSPSGVPTAEAIQPLQQQGGVVVGAALVGLIVRQLWIGAAMLPGQVRDRLLAAEATPAPARVERRPRTVHPLVAGVLSAGAATLALAGILEHLAMWVITFAVFFAVRWLRADQIRFDWLQRWRGIVDRAPAWARLIGLWLVLRAAATPVSNGGLVTSYTALAIVVLLSVVVVFAIFPGRPRPELSAREPETAA